MTALRLPPDTSPRHPIAVVADRTGLSQDILRVWERRYRAVTPARGPGGQRLYSDADVERLSLMAAATRSGRAIGQVAGLDTCALADLVADDHAAASARREFIRVDPAVDDAAEGIIAEALKATQALDPMTLGPLLRRASSQLGVPAFLGRVAATLLRTIGDEWHAGRMSPAHEHMATSIVEGIAVEPIHALASRGGSPVVLVATPAGERHVIGAAPAAASAALAGCNVLFLGADLPSEDIANAARASRASIVALSIIYVDDPARVVEEIRLLRLRLPLDVIVVVGGGGAESIAGDLRALGVRVQATFDDIVAEVRQRQR
jgi:MerR family transcriptional regulator, light-induced transcriptional regulator